MTRITRRHSSKIRSLQRFPDIYEVKQELPVPCEATSATLFPCCPAINPKIENIAKPANTLVAQFVMEIIRESLYKIENSDKKMSILFDSFLKRACKDC